MTEQSPAELDVASHRWFGKAAAALSETERRVLKLTKHRRISARHPKTLDEGQSLGDRLADRVATFGGSWTFIILFGVLLALWTCGNAWLLARPFDPYPFIFLNLMLSMLAAVQAPIIMMSQNRQASKDRQNAALDYEVNLKAELEIMALHDKLDQLRDQHILAVLESQREQIALLTRLVQDRSGTT